MNIQMLVIDKSSTKCARTSMSAATTKIAVAANAHDSAMK